LNRFLGCARNDKGCARNDELDFVRVPYSSWQAAKKKMGVFCVCLPFRLPSANRSQGQQNNDDQQHRRHRTENQDRNSVVRNHSRAIDLLFLNLNLITLL